MRLVGVWTCVCVRFSAKKSVLVRLFRVCYVYWFPPYPPPPWPPTPRPPHSYRWCCCYFKFVSLYFSSLATWFCPNFLCIRLFVPCEGIPILLSNLKCVHLIQFESNCSRQRTTWNIYTFKNFSNFNLPAIRSAALIGCLTTNGSWVTDGALFTHVNIEKPRKIRAMTCYLRYSAYVDRSRSMLLKLSNCV